jgi:hypothetical protein
MAEGIRAPNIPLGTSLSEFIGIETVGTTKSLRRFTRDSVVGLIEAIANSYQAGGGVVFKTKAEADAHLAYNAYQMAWVIQDTSAALNGVYQKSGASGAGGWARVGNLPYSFYRAVNSGAGTANAIVATNSYPLASTDALIVVNITDANTSGTVTVSFNGGPAYPIKTASGNDPAVGGFVPGMVIAGYITPAAEFHLITDQVSAAIQTAAEDAQAGAVAARDAALSAQPQAFPVSRAGLAGLPGTTPNAYLTEAGYEGYFRQVNSGDYTDLIAADTVGGEIKVTTGDSSLAYLRQRKVGDLFNVSEAGGSIAGAIANGVARSGGDVQINVAGTVTIPSGLLVPAVIRGLIGLGSDKTIIKPDAWDDINDFVNKSYAGGAGWAMFFDDANGGARTELPSFTTAGLKETSILFDSDTGLKSGDQIEIENEANWSFDGYRSYDRAGERNVVVAMEGYRAHLLYPLQQTYAYSSTLKAWKVPSVRRRAGGFTLDLTDAPDTATAWNAIKFFRVQGGEIDDIRVIAAKYEGVELDQCLGLTPTRIRASTRISAASTVQDYALMTASSRDIRWKRCEGAANWAGADFGTWGLAGGTPNDDVIYSESTFTAHGTSPAASMHSNVRRCGYHDCDIEGGMMMSGVDPFGTDCRVNVRRGSNAMAILGSELVRGRINLDGTEVVSALNAGATIGGAAVKIAAEASRFGGGADTIGGADGELFFSWKGGSLYAPSETRPFYFEEISNLAPISVDIDIEVQVDSVDADGLVRVLRTGTPVNPLYFRLRALNYSQAKPFGRWDGGYNPQEKAILPRQKNVWSDTSSATNSISTGSITLPHAYPSGYPVGATVSLMTSDLGEKVFPRVKSIDNTAISLSISTGDDSNMVTAKPFKVAWEVY